MTKKCFLFAASLVAMLMVGNAYATDPNDTTDATDTVGTAHDVYTDGTLSDVFGYATEGIAGVTYVNRMVDAAGNAAQNAEAHAASAGASALSAAEDAEEAAAAAAAAAESAATANSALADKQDKLVAGTNITIADDGKTISATDMRYTLPTASSTIKGGVKIGSNVSVTEDGTISVPTANGTNLGVVKQGSNITIASDGTISATDMRYTLPTASSDTKGGVKIGSNVSVTEDGTISVPTATAEAAGLMKWGQIPSGSAESETYATIWVE